MAEMADQLRVGLVRQVGLGVQYAERERERKQESAARRAKERKGEKTKRAKRAKRR